MSLIPPRKKRVYFDDSLDLWLLQEVAGQNPYEDANRWKVIKANMLKTRGLQVTERTIKERVQKLVNKFIENRENKNQYK